MTAVPPQEVVVITRILLNQRWWLTGGLSQDPTIVTNVATRSYERSSWHCYERNKGHRYERSKKLVGWRPWNKKLLVAKGITISSKKLVVAMHL